MQSAESPVQTAESPVQSAESPVQSAESPVQIAESPVHKFSPENVNFCRFLANQRGGPLKSRIFAIFQIRKSTENPEISEIAISLEF